MAPKKKGNQKNEDDWEAEALGEVADAPISASSTAQKEQLPEDGGETGTGESGGGGGGLLAALKKNKQSKKKKGKVLASDDFGTDEASDNLMANGASSQEPGATESTFQAPEEGDPDELFSAPSTKGKTAKGKPGKKDSLSQAEQGDPNDDTGGLKSKKEKEKEKKEREKQRKKEQAAKKKTTAPATSTTKPEPENKPPPEEAKADAPSTADNSKGKVKKLPAHLAAIQRQQELLRQEREARAQADAEERKRIEEEERQAAEEEKKKEEARQRKKEKEKAKKEQLKREGKLLTPAQREQQRRDEMKRQQMMAAGMQVAGMDDDSTSRKKPVYDSKRKKGAKKMDDKKNADSQAQADLNQEDQTQQERHQLEDEAQNTIQEVETSTSPAAVETDNIPESESDELDDWEKAAEADEALANKTNATVTPENNSALPNGQFKGAKDFVDPQSRPQSKKLAPDDSTSEDETSDDAQTTTTASKAAQQKKIELAMRRKQEHEEALAARSKDNLRSPICCILGHVDTGKTKLLDKVRQTNVQEGEAGGITQQIGATYFPVDALKTKTEVVNPDGKFEFKVPGLLVIDTPGHESFTNLRSRGSSLCNIAVLVVDIMHGLEPQTLESMRLLRDRKTPFIVALNKIDRLYGWKKVDNNGFLDSISKQNKGVQGEFRDRLERTKLAFSEQGFNAELFSENKSMARNVSLVPTSAHTGEGVPDLLKLLVSLTQERMANQLMYLSEVECTVLEVKVIEGLGTTIDVVLSNGVLHEGDQIVLCGLEGAISTKIRALLTPAPLKELRLKSQYVHNQECKAALGVKITANNLDNAIAGSRLLVARNTEEVEDLEEEVMSDIENLLSRVTKTGRGVSVQASTLGSLEALLEFLKVSKIPVANISIGPVYKRDVMTAGIMLEKSPEFAVMLCFDVKVDKEAQAYADEHGIKIFTADIIYHLFDDFTKHMAQLAEQRKEDNKHLAVFPCILQPIAVFMKKDPIVVGADVTEGNLRLQTPVAAIKINPITGVKEIVSLGRVTSIEREHKAISNAKKGSPSVAVKIEGPNQPLYGRHLMEKDTLYSLISRQSIDTLKELYRSEVSNDEWLLIKKLKPLFDVA